MSFSSHVKNELSRINIDNMEYLKAEFEGILLAGNYLSDLNGIRVATENAAFARRVYMLVKRIFGHAPEVTCRKNNRLRKHPVFTVESGLYYEKTGFSPDDYRSDMERVKSFLRGAFLSSGSISDPKKTYHLEINARSREGAVVIMALMEDYGLTPRTIKRKGNFIVYLKEGDNIADFLNIAGAHKSLLELENIRILKEMRNTVNRVVNCETANLDKTVNASLNQIQNIEYIGEFIGMENIPEGLRQAACLRLKHREASLKELGEMLDPPLGKSGVNHRMRKLEDIVKKHKLTRKTKG